jgi:hypothetical protein
MGESQQEALIGKSVIGERTRRRLVGDTVRHAPRMVGRPPVLNCARRLAHTLHLAVAQRRVSHPIC